MAILLFVDHDGQALSRQTANALTAARQIGGDIHALVAGPASVAAEAALLGGVQKVLHVEDAAYGELRAEAAAALLVQLAPQYAALVAPATSNGKNIMPRVAAKLDVMQISDISAVLGPKTFKRPIYAGNAIQTVEATDPLVVVTVRSASFEAAPDAVAAVAIEKIAPAEDFAGSRHVENLLAKADRPELTSARIVVSGGRALGSAEKFNELLLPLADRLDAGVGASRAAVDAGYAPNDMQVGQTGKIVAPELYIACGISGAIQHLAGMKDSKIIVAINKDPEAPIFQIADYGLVADIFEAVPEIRAALA